MNFNINLPGIVPTQLPHNKKPVQEGTVAVTSNKPADQEPTPPTTNDYPVLSPEEQDKLVKHLVELQKQLIFQLGGSSGGGGGGGRVLVR